jgi:hypothetical protein
LRGADVATSATTAANVICGNRLKQLGRDVDDAVPLAFIGNGSRNSMNWVDRMIV